MLFKPHIKGKMEEQLKLFDKENKINNVVETQNEIIIELDPVNFQNTFTTVEGILIEKVTMKRYLKKFK